MKFIATAGAVFFLLCAGAAAQNSPPTPPGKNGPPTAAMQAGMHALITCRPDVVRFCHDVVPGGGRIIVCLHNHMKELSPACRAVAPLLKPAPPRGNLPHPPPGSTPPK